LVGRAEPVRATGAARALPSTFCAGAAIADDRIVASASAQPIIASFMRSNLGQFDLT
jgi:hypothetical protein